MNTYSWWDDSNCWNQIKHNKTNSITTMQASTKPFSQFLCSTFFFSNMKTRFSMDISTMTELCFLFYSTSVSLSSLEIDVFWIEFVREAQSILYFENEEKNIDDKLKSVYKFLRSKFKSCWVYSIWPCEVLEFVRCINWNSLLCDVWWDGKTVLSAFYH